MKTKIIKSKFVEATNAVKGLLLKDPLSPFSKVLVDVVGENIAISGSNGDVMVTWRAFGESGEDGAFTVAGAPLAAFANAMPEGAVEISTEGKANKLKLSDGDSTMFKLATGEASSFPPMKGPETDGSLVMPGVTLREMLRKVKYAALFDDTRKNIGGVNFTGEGSILSMTAIDGRRLSHVEVDLATGDSSSREFDATLPNKAVAVLDNLLGMLEDDDDITIQLDSNAIRITAGRWCFTSKVLVDRFPNWRQILPENADNEVRFDRRAFLAALGRVSLVPGSDENGVKVEMNGAKIAFSARSLGESASADIHATTFNNVAKETFLVNPRLLKDVLTSLDDDEICIGFNSGNSPITIKCSVPFIGVIMPMRLA